MYSGRRSGHHAHIYIYTYILLHELPLLLLPEQEASWTEVMLRKHMGMVRACRTEMNMVFAGYN